jgi:hypothetical protein
MPCTYLEKPIETVEKDMLGIWAGAVLGVTALAISK